MKWYEGNEFQALSMRYNDHVELLRKLTDIDQKWFILSVTVQLLISGYLLQYNDQFKEFFMKLGIMIIDIALMVIGLRILYLNYIRRCEAVMTLKNVMEALGFTNNNIYLTNRAINPTREEYLPERMKLRPIPEAGFRSWWPYYKWGIIISIIGLGFLLFSVEISYLLKLLFSCIITIIRKMII